MLFSRGEWSVLIMDVPAHWEFAMQDASELYSEGLKSDEAPRYFPESFFVRATGLLFYALFSCIIYTGTKRIALSSRDSNFWRRGEFTRICRERAQSLYTDLFSLQTYCSNDTGRHVQYARASRVLITSINQ